MITWSTKYSVPYDISRVAAYVSFPLSQQHNKHKHTVMEVQDLRWYKLDHSDQIGNTAVGASSLIPKVRHHHIILSAKSCSTHVTSHSHMWLTTRLCGDLGQRTMPKRVVSEVEQVSLILYRPWNHMLTTHKGHGSRAMLRQRCKGWSDYEQKELGMVVVGMESWTEKWRWRAEWLS